MNEATEIAPPSDEEPSDEAREAVRAAFEDMFEPDIEHAIVSVADLVTEAGISEDQVRAVVDRFRLDLGSATTAGVVEDVVVGNNPLRNQPLIVTSGGERVMLPHSALTVDAVKENSRTT